MISVACKSCEKFCLVSTDVACQVIRKHHENYYGQDYQDQSPGKDTPTHVQMARICDLYGAVIFDRPYRNGMGRQEAVALMDNGSHFFNPTLLKVFKANLHQIELIPGFTS